MNIPAITTRTSAYALKSMNDDDKKKAHGAHSAEANKDNDKKAHGAHSALAMRSANEANQAEPAAVEGQQAPQQPADAEPQAAEANKPGFLQKWGGAILGLAGTVLGAMALFKKKGGVTNEELTKATEGFVKTDQLAEGALKKAEPPAAKPPAEGDGKQ